MHRAILPAFFANWSREKPAAQINFVNGVIDYLTERSVLELSQLSSALRTSHPDGILGVFLADYAALLSVVKSIDAGARAT